MPRYDYKCWECGYQTELIHTIIACDNVFTCDKCGCEMTREITAPHIEGSEIYPFKLWNVPHKDDGRDSVMVESKQHYKKLLKKWDSDCPAVHVGG